MLFIFWSFFRNWLLIHLIRFIVNRKLITWLILDLFFSDNLFLYWLIWFIMLSFFHDYFTLRKLIKALATFDLRGIWIVDRRPRSRTPGHQLRSRIRLLLLNSCSLPTCSSAKVLLRSGWPHIQKGWRLWRLQILLLWQSSCNSGTPLLLVYCFSNICFRCCF